MMNRPLTIAAAGAALCLLTVPGPARADGFYGAVRGGAALRAQDGAAVPSSDTGYVVAGTAGYVFPAGLALEGEIAFRELNSGGLGDSGRHYGFFANGLYEFAEGFVRPYIGAGLGVALVQAENFSLPGTPEDEGSAFAWQAIGGFAVQVSGRVDLLLDYRFTATQGLDLFGGDADDDLHGLTGGVRVRF